MLYQNTHLIKFRYIEVLLYLLVCLIAISVCGPQMPAMNIAADSKEANKFGVLNTFIIQNLGLVSGFVLMLLMKLYSGNIKFWD